MEKISMKIRKFDISQLCTNPHCLLIGKRGSGKSTVIDHIINYMTRIDKYDISICAPTEQMNHFNHRTNNSDTKICFKLTDKFFEEALTINPIINDEDIYNIENMKFNRECYTSCIIIDNESVSENNSIDNESVSENNSIDNESVSENNLIDNESVSENNLIDNESVSENNSIDNESVSENNSDEGESTNPFEHVENKFSKKIIVMDDCLRNGEIENDLKMELLMNARHYNITYFLALQIPYKFTPDLRLNFDYIFIFKEDCLTNKKIIMDCYAQIFPDFLLFDKICTMCTEKYSAMVIDNRRLSYNYNICDHIFYISTDDCDDPLEISIPPILCGNEKYMYNVSDIIDNQIKILNEIKDNYNDLVLDNLSLQKRLASLQDTGDKQNK